MQNIPHARECPPLTPFYFRHEIFAARMTYVYLCSFSLHRNLTTSYLSVEEKLLCCCVCLVCNQDRTRVEKKEKVYFCVNKTRFVKHHADKLWEQRNHVTMPVAFVSVALPGRAAASVQRVARCSQGPARSPVCHPPNLPLLSFYEQQKPTQIQGARRPHYEPAQISFLSPWLEKFSVLCSRGPGV